MNAFLKGTLHSIASAIIMYIPLAHFSLLNLTVGGIITIVANWLVSYTIPTTTGASSRQA